ncbi:HET-domain-containing protein, partial [Trematosphaeria pertusa]
RLIDVEHEHVIHAQPTERYAALSYVWGGFDQPTLKKDEISFFQTRGSLSALHLRLPKTIRDAMRICASLGIRHLWVDSLCIVQDALDEIENQTAHMDWIYKAAYLTIVVASGRDCDSGIPSIQPRERFQHSIIVEGVKLATAPTIELIEKRVQNSVWNTRAWTLQEYSLSRRCLVFTTQDYYLQCG